MINDLIDRAALLEALPKEDFLLSCIIRKCVVDAPAVDAEPVRHGCWKSRGDFLECSKCKCEYTQYDWEGSVVSYYYCPNCGAKMNNGYGG